MKPTSTTLLLDELRAGLVVPERYSRKSLYGRHEQLAITAVAACVTLIGSILLCEATRSGDRRD